MDKMFDKKILNLIFFLSIELLVVGILTISNSLASTNDNYHFQVYLEETKSDFIDIKTTLNKDSIYEREFIIVNDGNIDAKIEDYKIIGNKNDLDINIDTSDYIYSKDTSKIKVTIKLNDNIESKNIDLGISLIFKEM